VVIAFILIVLLMIAGGCVLSVQRFRSRSVKVLFGIMAVVSGGLFLLVLSLDVMAALSAPPSLKSLAKDFPARVSTLDALRSMSDEEYRYVRIASDWAYERDSGPPYLSRQVSLPSVRMSVYKRKFAAAGVPMGFQRDADGNIFFMAGSIGLLNRGFATGYLFCRDQGSSASQDSPFEPCALSKDKTSGEQEYMSDPRTEGYVFRKVADRWFVFKQGPS